MRNQERKRGGNDRKMTTPNTINKTERKEKQLLFVWSLAYHQDRAAQNVNPQSS